MAIPKEEQIRLFCNVCGKQLSQFELYRQEKDPSLLTYGLCTECAEDDTEKYGCKQLDENQERNWGGPRVPGPGKKIGRPAEAGKKKKVSFSLSPEAIMALDDLLIIHGTSKTSKSQIIEKLLLES